MPISLERRAFIANLHEPFNGNARKATDFYNEEYHPDKISYLTTIRIWREYNLEISPPGWHGNYNTLYKKRKRVIDHKNASSLKYLHARGKVL